MPRTVKCVKLGRELPGLNSPPFPGERGQRIFENVSQQAWQMWHEHSVLIMNHYGLNMVDPRSTETLMEEMEKFFFGDEASVPDQWVPEGEGTGAGIPEVGGKGAPDAKGAPSSKDAPASK